MPQRIIELECPGCAAALTTSDKICPKCFRPIVITTLDSIKEYSPLDLKKQVNTYNKALVSNPEDSELNLSGAFCYMRLKLYDKAIACFEKALEENFDNADAYFYAAIALLRGKKAFLSQRDTINKVIEYIDAANMIEPKGIYYYYLAYIKYDYFERKALKNPPDYRECIKKAVSIGLSEVDIDTLYELLEVDRPDEI